METNKGCYVLVAKFGAHEFGGTQSIIGKTVCTRMQDAEKEKERMIQELHNNPEFMGGIGTINLSSLKVHIIPLNLLDPCED